MSLKHSGHSKSDDSCDFGDFGVENGRERRRRSSEEDWRQSTISLEVIFDDDEDI